MYISGTHYNVHNPDTPYADWRDWASIAIGTTQGTHRMEQVRQIHRLYKDDIKRIVGHSYGGVLGGNLMVENPDLQQATLYNTPIIRGAEPGPRSRIKYKAHHFDPASVLTSRPQRNWYAGNPHSYRGFN